MCKRVRILKVCVPLGERAAFKVEARKRQEVEGIVARRHQHDRNVAQQTFQLFGYGFCSDEQSQSGAEQLLVHLRLIDVLHGQAAALHFRREDRVSQPALDITDDVELPR